MGAFSSLETFQIVITSELSLREFPRPREQNPSSTNKGPQVSIAKMQILGTVLRNLAKMDARPYSLDMVKGLEK